jgi:hypothetical protein
MLHRPFAVLHPHVTHSGHVISGVEQRQLAGIACIRRRRLTRPTVGVDDNQEMQIRVVVDAGGGVC